MFRMPAMGGTAPSDQYIRGPNPHGPTPGFGSYRGGGGVFGLGGGGAPPAMPNPGMAPPGTGAGMAPPMPPPAPPAMQGPAPLMQAPQNPSLGQPMPVAPNGSTTSPVQGGDRYRYGAIANALMQ